MGDRGVAADEALLAHQVKGLGDSTLGNFDAHVAAVDAESIQSGLMQLGRGGMRYRPTNHGQAGGLFSRLVLKDAVGEVGDGVDFLWRHNP